MTQPIPGKLYLPLGAYRLDVPIDRGGPIEDEPYMLLFAKYTTNMGTYHFLNKDKSVIIKLRKDVIFPYFLELK